MKVKVQLGPEKMGANMEMLREAVIRTVETLQQKRKQLLNCGEAEVRGQNRIMMLRAYCQSQTVELRRGKLEGDEVTESVIQHTGQAGSISSEQDGDLGTREQN